MMKENDWKFKLFKWLGGCFGFTGFNYVTLKSTGLIRKIGFSGPTGLTLRDQLRGKLGKLGLGDLRLPIRVNAGMANVVPWNTETTQVSTTNWPKGGFFLELKGCHYERPPKEVIILSAEGEMRWDVVRQLGEEEQAMALDFIREHWPEDMRRIHDG